MDNLKNHNDNVELCLVCCSKVESSKENDKLLHKNLLVIFLLKNVMQVSDEQVEENLKCNGNPVDWISLCEECGQLSKKALELHCQIVKTDRELWSVQKLIVEKTKSSYSSSSLIPVPIAYQNNIWERTRAFVINANCQSGSLPVNPFIEGDTLATANCYLRQNLYKNQDSSRSNQEDNWKFANFVQIKTEQSKPQLISDNEVDDDVDDDWQLDNNDDVDEVDSEDDNQSKPNYKKPNYPQRKKVNGKIQCNYCSKVFQTSSGCSKHEQEKHPNIPNQFPCQICELAWNSAVYLQKHMLRKHKVRLTGNQLTKLKSSNENNLNLEGRIPVTAKVKAEPENSDFEEIANLDDDDVDWQLDSENDEELDDSDAKSNQAKRIQKEQRLKVNGKFKCYHCDKVFSTNSGCYRHERENHASIPAQFSCEICDKAWNSKEYLNRHKKEVHPCIPNQYPCQVCGKRWNSSTYLQRHMKRIHKNGSSSIKEAPRKVRLRVNGKVKCYFCDKLFSKSGGCIRHENEKHASVPAQFPCEICGKAWNSREYLMIHKKKKHRIEELAKKKSGPQSTNDNGSKMDKLPINKRKSPDARKKFKFRKRVNGKIKCYYCDKVFFSVSGCHRHESEKHERRSSLKASDEIETEWSTEHVRKEPVDDNQVENENPLVITSSSKVKTELVPEDDDGKLGEIDNAGEFDDDDDDLRLDDLESAAIIDNDDYADKDFAIVSSRKKIGLIKCKKPTRKKIRQRINGKIKCNYCDKLFSGTNGCYMHEKEKHAKIPAQFRCDICDKTWNSKCYLSMHLTRAHGIESIEEKKEFFPEIIQDGGSSSLINREDLDNSEVSIRDVDEEPLDNDTNVPSAKQDEDEDDVQKKMMREAMGLVVEKSTRKSEKNQTDKLRDSSRDKPFNCTLCDKKFRDRYDLRRHEKSHKNEKRREQSSKTTEFRQQRGSKRELEWVDGKVKCGSCDKLFTSARGLRYHETLHKYREVIGNTEGGVDVTKPKRNFEWVDGKLKCESCDKKFSTESGLVKHEREKHDEGEFICELCGKVCTNLYKLKCHKKRVHLLKADGSRFVPRKYKLKKAEREEYGLPMKNGMGKRGINYLRIDGKLKCNSCDKLFISADGLYKHEKEKHPKKPGEFVCTHCGMAFNSLPYLRIHTERKHWVRMDGTPYQPPWVAKRKWKWKKSEK